MKPGVQPPDDANRDSNGQNRDIACSTCGGTFGNHRGQCPHR
jgi:hypothetical protein